MTFQQHTTSEQSVRLKELGLPQETEEHTVHYCEGVDGAREASDGSPLMDCSWDDEYFEKMILPVVRAFTRQELEDFLMGRCAVTLYTGAPGELRPFLELDTHFSGGELISCTQSFHFEHDPFPAIFDAVVYVLEHPDQFPPRA